MKTRRGSSYWGGGDAGMIAQFEAGDIVRPAGVPAFIGVVRDVQAKLNKVLVAWGGGAVSQHDPDEIQLVPYATENVKAKMASEGGFVETRRGSKISSDFTGADEPEQYVGDPRTHGLDKPRGGGFSIMQNLQKDLAPEALKESEKGPLVSPPEAEEIDVEAGGDQNAPDGDMNGAPEVVVSAAERVAFEEFKWRNKPLAVYENYQDGGYVRAEFEVTGPYDKAKGGNFKQGSLAYSMSVNLQMIYPKSGQTQKKRYGYNMAGRYVNSIKTVETALKKELEKYVVHQVGQKYDPNQWVKSGKRLKEGQKGSSLASVAGSFIKDMVSEIKDVPKAASASEGLKSRRAMYWMDKGRTYRLTKNEQGNNGATCPKCKGDMSKEPFTKSEKLFNCPGCGFKVPSGKVLTERKVEIEIEPDGNIEVEIEPASSRRGSLADL